MNNQYLRNYFYLEQFSKDYLNTTNNYSTFWPCSKSRESWSREIFVGVTYFLKEKNAEKWKFVSPSGLHSLFGKYARELYDSKCKSSF
jgi:hypothetical protein